MERTDIGLGTRRDTVDLDDEDGDVFYHSIVEHWLEGKVPVSMVHIDYYEEELEITYGCA